MEDLVRYDLNDPSSDRFFLTSSNLREREKEREKERTELIKFLTANIEVFGWTTYEMPEFDPYFIKHKLKIAFACQKLINWWTLPWVIPR